MAGHGRENLDAELGRITRARARVVRLESPELSADDSPFNPTSSTEESIEVSLIDSERVEFEAAVESDDRDNMIPVRELEVGSGSGGNAPVTATVDLQQFFN